MPLPSSRILTAVPRTLEVRLEIAQAIQRLTQQHDEPQHARHIELAKVPSEHELVAEIVRDA
jgi:hypothetical protein